jgi:protein SCO1/2
VARGLLLGRIGRILAVVVAAGIAVVIALTIALHRGSARSPGPTNPLPLRAQAVWGAHAKPAPALVLKNQNGGFVSLNSERGRPVLLTFLDSHCRQACPVEGRLLGQVWHQRAAQFHAVLLVVSVNPWEDTPHSARQFMNREIGWGGSWDWLFGTPTRLSRVWRAYDIEVKRGRSDVGHGAALFMIDRQGFMRRGYLVPFTPATVIADLRLISRPE